MLQITIVEEEQPDGKPITLFGQSGKEPVRANLFLENGCFVRDGVTCVRCTAKDALADVLLGVQLYNIRCRKEPLRLRIRAAVNTRAAPVRCTDRVLGQIVRRSVEGGQEVRVRDIRGKEGRSWAEFLRKSGRGEEKVEMSSTNYEIPCPSFEDFLKENGKPTKKEDSRAGALDFAHPVDAGIIRVLDTPAVNKVFASIVDLSVDASYGLTLSTGIRVDESDPELSAVLRHCAGTLKIGVPYTVISSSVKGINAMTVGTDEFNYIAVGSLMKAILDKEEMEFVLGHECGHIALGHVLYHTVVSTARNVSELLPVIGPAVYQAVAWPLKAWSRRSEISADRAGLLCCRDRNVACRTLLKLEAGFMNVDDIKIDDYISDTNQSIRRSQIGWMKELMADHPILAKRMEAIRLFADSEKYYRLSGLTPPEGHTLLTDAQLEKETERIVKVAK